MMLELKELRNATLDYIKAVTHPYGNFNERMDFTSCSYYYSDRIPDIEAKVFITAMIVYYRQNGFEDLSNRLSLVFDGLRPDEVRNPFDLYEYSNELSDNGNEVIKSIEAFGWCYEGYIFDGYDYHMAGPNWFDEPFRSNFYDLIDAFSFCFEPPSEDDEGDENEERDYDYCPEGDAQLSRISSQKLGRYLYYKNKNEGFNYQYDEIIQYLTAQLIFPFIGEGYADAKLIGDTYFIAWITGYWYDCFDKSARDVDYYFPLYAYWLDKYLDLAYEDLDILSFCEANPPKILLEKTDDGTSENNLVNTV